jgi:molybdopterin-guanine dinucleotide biosynthesis protein A
LHVDGGGITGRILDDCSKHSIWEVGFMKASGIILAGGHSSRMGQDKALLHYNQETLIERSVKELQQAVDEVIVIVNDKLKYHLSSVREIPDVYPDMGPLGGMHAGLLQARHEYSFIISCDMPLFSARLAEFLLERSGGYDVVVPKLNDYWEPLCAVYSKNCIASIEKCLRSGVRKVLKFYDDVRVLEIGPDELEKVGRIEDLFYNMNTPEEYRSFLLRMGEKPPEAERATNMGPCADQLKQGCDKNE